MQTGVVVTFAGIGAVTGLVWAFAEGAVTGQRPAYAKDAAIGAGAGLLLGLLV